MGQDNDLRYLRFPFGQNWANYLATVNECSLSEARNSIVSCLGYSDLTGKSFLDVGCGSGLFSLAAQSLGACVTSFDYDAVSVVCAERLKAQYFPSDSNWKITRGSVQDQGFLLGLGRFDIVYAWGVLHHTGAMWAAIDNVVCLVRSGGILVIAIYNDQGHWSRIWLRIKQLYNKLPRLLRPLYVMVIMFPRELRSLGYSVLTLQPLRYLQSWTQYRRFRGMSKWHDLVDWVGGLPFEVAKPEQVINFLQQRGFKLQALTTCAGEIGCNEYVFRRTADGCDGD